MEPVTPLSVTVLGSGGPILTAHRVSSGYVIRLDGAPRLLVDAGGGVFERLGRADIDLGALELVALTHMHIDHSGGLAPVVFALWMQGRKRALRVVGPGPRDDQPGCTRFCELLFGPEGAWRYLHSFEGFAIDTMDVPSDPDRPEVREVFSDEHTSVRAVAVPHGMMPALAYRIDHRGRSLVMSGDIARPTPAFIELAREADLLVHDQAVPAADAPEAHLHTDPAATARGARDAGVKALLLTHFMPEAEAQLRDIDARVRESFDGPIYFAEDLATYEC